MTYLRDKEDYLCAAGRKLTVTSTRTVKSKTGYASAKTCYKADRVVVIGKTLLTTWQKGFTLNP